MLCGGACACWSCVCGPLMWESARPDACRGALGSLYAWCGLQAVMPEWHATRARSSMLLSRHPQPGPAIGFRADRGVRVRGKIPSAKAPACFISHCLAVAAGGCPYGVKIGCLQSGVRLTECKGTGSWRSVLQQAPACYMFDARQTVYSLRDMDCVYNAIVALVLAIHGWQ